MEHLSHDLCNKCLECTPGSVLENSITEPKLHSTVVTTIDGAFPTDLAQN